VDRGWLIVSVVAIAGFLPVLTLKRRAIRISVAALAALSCVAMISMYRAATAPNVGLGGFVIIVPALGAGILLVCLFCVGLAGAAAWGIERVNKVAPPAWVTPVLSLVLALIVFGVPFALSRVEAGNFYSKNEAIVAAARNGAGPQTREQLTQRVLDVLQSALDTGTDATQSARDGILLLWHPASLKSDEYFLEDPEYTRDYPYSPDDGIGLGIRNELMDQFRASEDNGSWVQARPGDTFTAVWRGEVPLTAINEEYRWLLSFYDDTRWNGKDFIDGRPIFPDGRFYELDVSLNRGDLKAPFVTLWAVDDGGKWWLVGIDNPNWPKLPE
jgi:hypothetical protein